MDTTEPAKKRKKTSSTITDTDLVNKHGNQILSFFDRIKQKNQDQSPASKNLKKKVKQSDKSSRSVENSKITDTTLNQWFQSHGHKLNKVNASRLLRRHFGANRLSKLRAEKAWENYQSFRSTKKYFLPKSSPKSCVGDGDNLDDMVEKAVGLAVELGIGDVELTELAAELDTGHVKPVVQPALETVPEPTVEPVVGDADKTRKTTGLYMYWTESTT